MRKYSESIEQQGLLSRAGKRAYGGGTLRDYIFAIPNAGSRGGVRGARQGARRKAEGVVAGVPDLECFVAVAPYTGLHVEMKKLDGVPSDVSQEQKDMMARLTRCGRKCTVAFGADMAWKQICEYLGIKP
jgi:hypothetical protein